MDEIEERLTVIKLRWYVVAFIFLVTLPSQVFSQEFPKHVFETDGLVAKMMDKPCTDPATLALIVAALPEKYHKGWKHMDSNFRMRDGSHKDFAGCWFDEEDSVTVLWGSDGMNGSIKKSQLKRAKGSLGV
jgi:hypothetical protein